MTIFFTGDLHLNDPRMLTFTNPDGTFCRPFASVREHDDYICDNWQDTVGANDTVYLTGDIASDFAGIDRIGRLNGEKHLILGNNDKLNALCYAYGFESVRACVAFPEYRFIASHRPIHERDFDGRFTHNVHAHVHCNLIEDARYINTSLEATEMKPMALEAVLELMQAQQP